MEMRMTIKKSVCLFLAFAMAVQLQSLVSARSKVHDPSNGGGGRGLLHNSEGVDITERALMGEAGGRAHQNGSGEMTEVSKIGSSPPSCENKCYGCTPCEATQVPATNHGHGHVRTIQYTNYEPEGWKCKCGPSLYSP